MNFTKESQTVKNFIFLIRKGERTINDVPNLFNLKQVVLQVIEEANEDAV